MLPEPLLAILLDFKMSFDIIVIRPLNSSVRDICKVVEVLPLGSVDDVKKAFDDAFPGSRDGIFVESDG